MNVKALNTPEQVEDILRRAITDARARGIRIERGVQDFIAVRPDGVTCACALGCAVLDGPRDDRRKTFRAAMRALNISETQAQQLINGFDGWRPPRGPQRTSKWRDLGGRLWTFAEEESR